LDFGDVDDEGEPDATLIDKKERKEKERKEKGVN
jgi:hypothetical protein